MKNFTLSLFITIISLAASVNAFAQSYGTVQLPCPDELTPLFLGSLTHSKIYYGAEPVQSDNRPVLVFVHGFIDLANLWFLPGNRMYDRAYDGGYRSAFVAMTRGGGMWENGDLLADMLENITAHYGVNNVVIVAHSNGGKASEVAMFHHGKNHLVDRVISLGTPFGGTQVANLAETFWFRWLVDFVGLGGGTATSTTYYMGGVARPYLDNLSNNQPNKFFNLGAWGYNSGTTLFAPTMFTTGLLLNANGSGWYAGGNDGVTPYWSSSRPGGLRVWNPGYGNPVSRHDHIDVALDYIVWPVIEPYFTGPLGQLRASTAATEERIVRSNVQYLSSEGQQFDFMVEEDAQDIVVSVLHSNADDVFKLTAASGKALAVKATTTAGRIGNFSTTFTIDYLEPGAYQIETANRFGAFVQYNNGVELVYQNKYLKGENNYEAGESFDLALQLDQLVDADDIEVTAMLTRKAIDGKIPVATDDALQIVTLTQASGNQYAFNFETGLEEGVYNVMFQVNGKDFAKSLVSGFVVKSSSDNDVATIANTLSLDVYPNPVADILTINFTNQEDNQLSIFDAYGRLVNEFSVDNNTGSFQLNVKDYIGETGSYFVRLQNGKEQLVRPIVVVK